MPSHNWKMVRMDRDRCSRCGVTRELAPVDVTGEPRAPGLPWLYASGVDRMGFDRRPDCSRPARPEQPRKWRPGDPKKSGARLLSKEAQLRKAAAALVRAMALPPEEPSPTPTSDVPPEAA